MSPTEISPTDFIYPSFYSRCLLFFFRVCRRYDLCLGLLSSFFGCFLYPLILILRATLVIVFPSYMIFLSFSLPIFPHHFLLSKSFSTLRLLLLFWCFSTFRLWLLSWSYIAFRLLLLYSSASWPFFARVPLHFVSSLSLSVAHGTHDFVLSASPALLWFWPLPCPRCSSRSSREVNSLL